MKKIVRTWIILIIVLILTSLAAYAAPQGYIEVELTKSNFKKYFEVAKMKLYDKGKYCGYEFVLRSKLLKKGYYLYSAEGFSVKLDATVRCKCKYKTMSFKVIRRMKRILKEVDEEVFTVSKSAKVCPYPYKDGKYNIHKVLKAEGKLVFITPDNVIALEKRINSEGRTIPHPVNDEAMVIKLKYPYNSQTSYDSHFDKMKNENVIDYYYKDTYDGCCNAYYVNNEIVR